MLSIDTNLLFHSFNLDSPNHNEAYDWLNSIQMDEDIAISEFVLAELTACFEIPLSYFLHYLHPKPVV